MILGISKDADSNITKERRADLSKITKYLIRQTHTEKKLPESESCKKLKSLSFWDFLYEVGMFGKQKLSKEFTDQDKNDAKKKYLNAISASVQGTAVIILKREVKDIFVN